MRRDSRAITLDHAPIDVRRIVVLEVVHRQLIEIAAADVTVDGADQSVPAVAGLEQFGCWPVGFLGRGGLAREEGVERVDELALALDRKAIGQGRPLRPRWRRLVEAAALALCDCHPGVAVGGVKPAAAEVERVAGVRFRERASAQPSARLDQQAPYACIMQAPRRGDAGSAAAEHDDLVILVGHDGTLGAARAAASARQRPQRREAWLGRKARAPGLPCAAAPFYAGPTAGAAA